LCAATFCNITSCDVHVMLLLRYVATSEKNLALLSPLHEISVLPGAEGGDDEEEVAEDGHHDGDHVQGDPPPPVVLAQDVPNIGDHLHMGPSILHCKIRLSIFPSPAGMPTPWPGISKLFPTRDSLVSHIPSGDGKIDSLFLQCMTTLQIRLGQYQILMCGLDPYLFFNRISSLMQASAVSRSRIHERTISMKFLDIILRVLRLRVLNGFLNIIGKGVWLSIRFSSFFLYIVE
jgi:hypothetical protein